MPRYNETDICFFLYFFSPFFFIIGELLFSLSSRSKKLRKLLKPSSLPDGFYMRTRMQKLQMRWRAALNHKDSRLFPLERGPISSLFRGGNKKSRLGTAREIVPDFTTALRSLSKTDRPKRPILSLLRRFYAPLMEPKLRTIGRYDPSGQLTVSETGPPSNASCGRTESFQSLIAVVSKEANFRCMSHFSDFNIYFYLFQ